jgi:hypothetical protein
MCGWPISDVRVLLDQVRGLEVSWQRIRVDAQCGDKILPSCCEVQWEYNQAEGLGMSRNHEVSDHIECLEQDLVRIVGINDILASGYAARAFNHDNAYALATCQLQRLITTQWISGRVLRRLLDVSDRVLAFKAVTEGDSVSSVNEKCSAFRRFSRNHF